MQVELIKDYAGKNNNINNNNKRHLPLALERHRPVTMGTVRNVQIVVCYDGGLANLMNYFMFLAFKKFYNLNINKNDKVIYKYKK